MRVIVFPGLTDSESLADRQSCPISEISSAITKLCPRVASRVIIRME